MRQSMWDLWWTKWHKTAVSIIVSVLRHQMPFQQYSYTFIYHVRDAQWPHSVLQVQQIEQPHSKRRTNKNEVSYIVQIYR
jgi:hypothetical protein